MKTRLIGLATAALFLVVATTARAADFMYWDADGASSTAVGGSGNWGTANTWRNLTPTGAQKTWIDGNTPRFQGTAGTVTLGGNRSASNLIFSTTGYIIDAGAGEVLTLITPLVNVNGSTLVGTVNATIGGTVGLDSMSTGRLVLGGTNTYSGTTNVYGGGELLLNSAGALGSSSSVIVNGDNANYSSFLSLGEGANGATFTQPLTLNALLTNKIPKLGFRTATPISATWAGGITLTTTSATGAAPQISTSEDGGVANTLKLTGDISSTNNTALVIRGGSGVGLIEGSVALGTGLLFKTGSSTWVIGNSAVSKDYAWGGTSVRVGTLKMASANVLPNATLVTLGEAIATGTLDINNHAQTIGGLVVDAGVTSGSGILTNSGSTDTNLTINNSSIDYSYKGAISGAINLIKDGAAKQTLTGINTYTGTTEVNAGTLALSGNGSIATPTIDVASGAIFDVSGVTGGYILNAAQTLKGAGTVDGAMIVNGNLSPGNSPGLLTTGDETWAGDGKYTWEINSVAGAAGTDPGWDLVNMGALTMTATSENPFTIALHTLTLSNAPGEVADFVATESHAWKIASATSISGWDVDDGAASSLFAIDPSGVTNSLPTNAMVYVSKTGNDVFLNYAVPEPGMLAMLGTGLVGLLAYAWRKLK